MSRLRAVLLDVDGTLLDSVDAHAGAWAEALREDGIGVAVETVRPLVGMGGDKLVPAISGIASDSERGRRISERRGEIFRSRYMRICGRCSWDRTPVGARPPLVGEMLVTWRRPSSTRGRSAGHKLVDPRDLRVN